MDLLIKGRIITFLSIWYVLLVTTSNAQEVSRDFCDKTTLPLPVQSVLQKKYSDWRILNLNDLKEYQDEKEKQVQRKTCPGIAVGHFQNKLTLSYGLILISQRPNISSYQFIVIGPNSKGLYQDHLLEKIDYPPNPQIIYTVPPHTFYNFQKETSVTSPFECLQSEEFKHGEAIFCWIAGKFHMEFLEY